MNKGHDDNLPNPLSSFGDRHQRCEGKQSGDRPCVGERRGSAGIHRRLSDRKTRHLQLHRKDRPHLRQLFLRVWPGKTLIRGGLLGTFVIPSYLAAIAWILLAGPNAGWINRAWMFLSGAENGLFNVYSFGGLVFVSALYAIPYIFIYVSDGLSAVSTEMEDAARMLGAGPIGVAVKITLPLVAPAIFT